MLRRAALVVLLSALAAAPACEASVRGRIDFHRWASTRAFRSGTLSGTAIDPHGGLVLTNPIGTHPYTDPTLRVTKPYEFGRWVSPLYSPGFPAGQLVASWNAVTPPGTWLQVAMRGVTETGRATKWYVLGRWASGDGDIHRTSVPGQADANGDVNVDTFVAAAGKGLTSYRLRVTLYRLPGSGATPRVSLVGAMTSMLPDRTQTPPSRLGGAEGIELQVPRYSQSIHAGQYPQYDNGGEAWCSPTSTQMVVEYWRTGPTRQDLAWVDPSYPDPQVAHAARMTYDYQYGGAGNWPFNTAYAASFGLHAEVTRLRSLNDVEQFIKHGIPVITSLSFRADELDGAGYSTAGHLMVVVGFTKEGDVIANDPASPADAAVRHVYKRAQFENVWLRTKRVDPQGKVADGSGGIVYLIWPKGMKLPPKRGKTARW
jgi:hypothetical protein